MKRDGEACQVQQWMGGFFWPAPPAGPLAGSLPGYPSLTMPSSELHPSLCPFPEASHRTSSCNVFVFLSVTSFGVLGHGCLCLVHPSISNTKYKVWATVNAHYNSIELNGIRLLASQPCVNLPFLPLDSLLLHSPYGTFPPTGSNVPSSWERSSERETQFIIFLLSFIKPVGLDIAPCCLPGKMLLGSPLCSSFQFPYVSLCR